MFKNLAVIILNYNSSNDCVKCVEQLKKQHGVTIEIIVVDNSSSDEEREKVHNLCRQNGLTFLPSCENRGYAAGNNIGLKYAARHGFQYAAICNPDMEFPQADCLMRCMGKMISDNSIAVLAPDIVMPDGTTHQNPQQDGGDDFWSILMEPYYLFKGLILGNLPKSFAEEDWKSSRYCSKVVGCFFLIRIDFLQCIGFLDEGTFLYCEEPILARRVRDAGMRVYYLSEARAIHNHVRTSKGNPCHNMKQFQKSRLYFYKHYCNLTCWEYICVYFTRMPINVIWRFLLWLKYRFRRSS